MQQTALLGSACQVCMQPNLQQIPSCICFYAENQRLSSMDYLGMISVPIPGLPPEAAAASEVSWRQAESHAILFFMPSVLNSTLTSAGLTPPLS